MRWVHFPRGSDGKESAWNTWDLALIIGSGRSPGKGIGNPLQYSCLENSMDRGAWKAAVHGVPKSQTWLAYTHTSKRQKRIDKFFKVNALRKGKSGAYRLEESI